MSIDFSTGMETKQRWASFKLKHPIPAFLSSQDAENGSPHNKILLLSQHFFYEFWLGLRGGSEGVLPRPPPRSVVFTEKPQRGILTLQVCDIIFMGISYF